MSQPDQARSAHDARRAKLLGLWIANVLSIVTMAVAAMIDVETIVGTGPALTLIGLALGMAARPFRSWIVMGFALSGPLVCALVAGLISGLRLGPSDAQEPVSQLLAIYAAVALPASLFALRSILRTSQRGIDPHGNEYTWQFSLRSLLLVTTAVCVLVAIGRAVLANNMGSDYGLFGLFNLVTLTLVGLTVYSYVRKA